MIPIAIIAGGLGTRLGSISANKPKSLVEINGKPFIDWQISLLKKQEISQIVMCVSHKAEMIMDYVGNGSRYGLEIEYSFDNPVLNGTGSALRNAVPLLGEKFIVLYGDSYLPVDLFKITQAFVENKYTAMMTIYKNNSEYDISNVKYLADGSIYYKKNSLNEEFNYIDYGLNFFTSEIFSNFQGTNFLDISEIFEALSEKKLLVSYEVYDRFFEIGSHQGIHDLSKYLKENNVNI